jgi:signal transduction histidine kinase
MGLPICFRIIEKHKGKIQAESQLGTGTTLTIQLPVRMEQTDFTSIRQ